MFLLMTLSTKPPQDSAEDRLTRLMQTYGSQVLRVCYLYLKHRALAQHASQTAFVAAGMRIAVNTCKTMLRSREYRLYAQSPDLDELPLSAPEDASPDDTVLHAVLALPEKYREVVTLYYYQSLSSQEVARVLRVPQATVLTRLNRARRLLESELKGWYFDHE